MDSGRRDPKPRSGTLRASTRRAEVRLERRSFRRAAPAATVEVSQAYQLDREAEYAAKALGSGMDELSDFRLG
jgi:hypothetical protein